MQKEQEQNNRDKVISSAQLRKSLSIAYFNSNNSAIELVSKLNITDTEQLKDAITSWRDWFIEEYKQYHIDNIDKVTPENIDIHEAVKQILGCTTTAEVRLTASKFPDSVRNSDEFLTSARQFLAQLKATENKAKLARSLEDDSALPTISIDEPLPVKKSRK